MMKTLFLYTESPNEGRDTSICFFEKEGDFSHLDGTFANATNDQGKIEELINLVFHPETGEFLPLILKEPTKDWDFFVSVGFLL